MSLRISGGVFKGRIIKTLAGRDTRPTTGRVREAIFSIIQHNLVSAHVLDLFAGSGALGIEALSRGAATLTLVEKNKQAAEIVRQNLKALGLTARLFCLDYRRAMEKLAGEGDEYDLILADPPYMLISPDDLVEEVGKYRLSKPETLLIMEHAGKVVPTDRRTIKTRRFGDSAITVFGYAEKP